MLHDYADSMVLPSDKGEGSPESTSTPMEYEYHIWQRWGAGAGVGHPGACPPRPRYGDNGILSPSICVGPQFQATIPPFGTDGGEERASPQLVSKCHIERQLDYDTVRTARALLETSMHQREVGGSRELKALLKDDRPTHHGSPPSAGFEVRPGCWLGVSDSFEFSGQEPREQPRTRRRTAD